MCLFRTQVLQVLKCCTWSAKSNRWNLVTDISNPRSKSGIISPGGTTSPCAHSSGGRNVRGTSSWFFHFFIFTFYFLIFTFQRAAMSSNLGAQSLKNDVPIMKRKRLSGFTTSQDLDIWSKSKWWQEQLKDDVCKWNTMKEVTSWDLTDTNTRYHNG